MKVGVVVFPGSNSDVDSLQAVEAVTGRAARAIWHKETSLGDVDVVILPGGFAHGDYLRAGAIARFAPIVPAVERFARDGGTVAGFCNGFQVLTEMHLLPGALVRNAGLRFRSELVRLRVENARTRFTSAYEEGEVVRFPIAHGEGNYVASRETLDRLEAEGRVVFRYVDAEGRATPRGNPNGSARNIAGILNEEGNVLGLMPHPERAWSRLIGSDDGRRLFESLMAYCSPGSDRVAGAGRVRGASSALGRHVGRAASRSLLATSPTMRQPGSLPRGNHASRRADEPTAGPAEPEGSP
jgi:phosphoribosylformylglycinamidine synthase